MRASRNSYRTEQKQYEKDRKSTARFLELVERYGSAEEMPTLIFNGIFYVCLSERYDARHLVNLSALDCRQNASGFTCVINTCPASYDNIYVKLEPIYEENELIVALFFKNIDSAVQSYYSNYFSILLEVYNYEIQIKDLSKVNNIITIRFGVTPQIGAHNPVGYDEIIFSTDNNGQREFLAYEHIKTYTLDKRFNEYIINPLPQ